MRAMSGTYVVFATPSSFFMRIISLDAERRRICRITAFPLKILAYQLRATFTRHSARRCSVLESVSSSCCFECTPIFT